MQTMTNRRIPMSAVLIFILPLLPIASMADPIAMPNDLAIAQATPSEGSLIQTVKPANDGPFVHNFKLPKIDGSINLLIDKDGTWNFSGSVGKAMADKEFDITLVIKSKSGSLITFHYVGDASHGLKFNREGKNDVVKDNFALFTEGYSWEWHYRFYESKAGLKKIWEEKEAKKARLRHEEEEARKHHQEEVAAEKKKELQAEELAEMKWELKQLSQEGKQSTTVVNNNNNNNNGGGSGGGDSLLGTLAGAAGLLACL